MGRISVWKPWLGVAAGALLTPLLVIALTGFISGRTFASYGQVPEGGPALTETQ